MDPMVAFGSVIRRLRKEAGVSQEAIACKAAMGRNFVSLIERGLNQPTVRVVFKLAAALETTPSRIFQAVEDEIAENSRRAE